MTTFTTPHGIYVEFPALMNKKCLIRIADISAVHEVWDDAASCTVWLSNGEFFRLECTYEECCAALGMTATPTA